MATIDRKALRQQLEMIKNEPDNAKRALARVRLREDAPKIVAALLDEIERMETRAP